MSLGYISEKLTVAVNTMATSAAPIKKRLEYAMLGAHTISMKTYWEKFPDPEVAERWHAWWATMTSKEAVGGEGRIVATISQMTEEQAEEAAEELFNIYRSVERIYGGSL